MIAVMSLNVPSNFVTATSRNASTNTTYTTCIANGKVLDLEQPLSWEVLGHPTNSAVSFSYLHSKERYYIYHELLNQLGKPSMNNTFDLSIMNSSRTLDHPTQIGARI